MTSSTQRAYTIALASCKGLEPGTLRKLISGCGGAFAVWTADVDAWRDVCRLSETTVRILDAWRNRIQSVDQVESLLRERGIRCVVRGDEDYPSGLHDLAEPPLVVFAKGQTEDLNTLFASKVVVSVVGTRRASAYGLEATRWIVGTIAARGWHVVSGLAMGIDLSAHNAAESAHGVTSAVLACGVDLCYPVNHKHTYDTILKSGCVLSEYAPGTPVAKHRFPERNRIIAALSSTLIVVQAGEKSGALGTAEIALDLGREIYVVPGPITSVHYLGSNRLLADGAAVLLNPEEFLLDHGYAELTMESIAEPPERWQTLYNALTEPLGATALAQVLSVPISHVYAGLLELELEGWVERQSGAVYGRTPKNLHPNSARC